MNKIDILQIIAIVTALALGYLPNFVEVKKRTRLTKGGVIILWFLFIASLSTAIWITIYNSTNEKIREERKQQSYKDELSIAFEQFKALDPYILFSGESILELSKEDSVRKIDLYISFSSQSVNLLTSQLQNDQLLKYKEFQKIWILYIDAIRDAQIRIYGYDRPPLNKIYNVLQANSKTFVLKIKDYENDLLHDLPHDTTHDLKLISGKEFRRLN